MFFGKKKDTEKAWGESRLEARKFPRMRLKTLVHVTEGGREGNCKLHDISLGGLAFVAPWPLQVGARPMIELGPPEGPHGRMLLLRAQIRSAVVRCRSRTVPPGGVPSWLVAVRFVDATRDDEAIVRAWFRAFGESETFGVGGEGARPER